jgi:hypothetical protein
MSNQPNTSDDGDRVVPFMPVLRNELGVHLSPPATKLMVTSGAALVRSGTGLSPFPLSGPQRSR